MLVERTVAVLAFVMVVTSVALKALLKVDSRVVWTVELSVDWWDFYLVVQWDVN